MQKHGVEGYYAPFKICYGYADDSFPHVSMTYINQPCLPVCVALSLCLFLDTGVLYIIVRVFKVCLVKGEISVVVLYQCCACVSTGHDPTYLVSERKGTDGILFKVLIYNNNSSNPFI